MAGQVIRVPDNLDAK